MATPSSSAVKPEPGRGIRSPARDAFESYGISGRVRCKLCFQEWLKKNIEHAVAHGEDLETATKKFRALQEPPRVDVPNFHYASSAPIHAHVLEKHSELIDCKQSVKSDQRKLFFPPPALVKGHTDKEVKAALVHCMNPTVPIRLVSDPWHVQAYGQVVHRNKLPDTIRGIAKSLLASIQGPLRGCEITLALDGYTSWRHLKAYNFVLLHGNRAIFCTVALSHPG